MVSSVGFDRTNRSLLTEAPATYEANASLATETKRTSALALAATQPMTVRDGIKKDGLSAG
jgi:hypothetical protein